MARAISPVADAVALVALARELRRLRPDIVHTHASKAGILGRAAARLAGRHGRCQVSGVRERPDSGIDSTQSPNLPISPFPNSLPVLHTPHTFYFQGCAGVKRRIFRRFEALALPLTRRLVLLSEGQARLAREEFGVAMPPYSVIENGVDTQRFAPGDRAAARRELGLPRDVPVIGTIMRFLPQKDPDTLAVGLLRSLVARPEAHALIVGDGPLLARALETLRPVAARVHRLPDTDRPEAIYPALDVFALSSRYEGMPYTLLEGMACGVPCVVPRISGCAEVVEDGRTGLLTAPGDPGALARGLMALLDDAELRHRLGVAARAVAAERFPLRRFVARMTELYEQSVY